jgi:gluconolactonase
MRYAMMMVLVAGLSHTLAVAQESATPQATEQAAKVSYPTGSVFAEAFKVVGEGYAFTEGPAFIKDDAVQPLGGYFLFCDVSPSQVLRWNGDDKAPEVYFEGTEGGLGLAVKADGTLVQCRKDSRSVVEVKIADGKVTSTTTRAADFEGKRLNATNDCIVASDGSIWFTDPPFFTPKADLQLDFTGIFRVSPEGVIEAKARGVQYANGLAFSPDEKTLYVNDFRGRKVLAYAVDDKGALSAEPTVVADLAAMAKEVGAQGRGGADGLRVRSDGTILATGPGGVYAVDSTGKLRDFLPTGSATNVAIGGADGNVAFVTAGGRVLSVRLAPVAASK